MDDDHPVMAAATDRTEPVPRRIRGFIGADLLFDTIAARYVWEWPYYPQYYIPLGDVLQGVLDDENECDATSRGDAHLHGVRIGEVSRPRAARVLRTSSIPELKDTVRFDWDAIDAWYEEDERVFVHPRNPYVRVDALRSTRTVRVELEGRVLAESSSPVMVFETGLATRYYLNSTDVDFEHLVPTDTVTECPYKGTTTDYWSVDIDGTLHEDLAWRYDFPTRQLLPITGLVAFYDEKVDVFVDGQRLS